MKTKIYGIVWGLILIAAGVILALDILGVITVQLFFDGWWTLIIIIPCAVGLFTERSKLGNAFGLVAGIFLLLWQRSVLSFQLAWKLLIPVAIVIFGVQLLYRTVFRKKSEPTVQTQQEAGKKIETMCATFSGCDVNYSGNHFHGAELVAIFGGVKCDLRQAVIDEDCVIKVTAVFGGIDVLVPENVKVQMRTTSIFGGVSDQTKPQGETVTLYVEGMCIFGGTDIK